MQILEILNQTIKGAIAVLMAVLLSVMLSGCSGESNKRDDLVDGFIAKCNKIHEEMLVCIEKVASSIGETDPLLFGKGVVKKCGETYKKNLEESLKPLESLDALKEQVKQKQSDLQADSEGINNKVPIDISECQTLPKEKILICVFKIIIPPMQKHMCSIEKK